MPIVLHVDDLKPGLCLAQSVYRGDQCLITGGQKLEQWMIDSLRRRFPDLTLRVLDPILDAFTEFEDDTPNQEVGATVIRRMSRLMGGVQKKLGSHTALGGADLAGIQGVISHVIEYLRSNPVTAAVLVQGEGGSNYLQEHAANVMYLSILIGNAIRDCIYRERTRSIRRPSIALRYGLNLTPLAVGCLVHDIGMAGLEELYQLDRPLTDTEMETIRRHPIVGVERLPHQTDAVAKMVVRTHHENCNGMGYPCGIPGDKLHIFSRIVRVADAYDAGTSVRTYREAKSPPHVLWEIAVGSHRHLYDRRISRILAGLIQPFPIGAKVRLDCGRYGVVVKHNRKQPFRPTIIEAFDEEGHRLRKRDLKPPVDLAFHDDIRLIEYAGKDLSYLNEAATREFLAMDLPEEEDVIADLDAQVAPCTDGSFFSFLYP